MNCIHCGMLIPESAHCPNCGKAIQKWCPQCGDWKSASFRTAEVDDGGGTATPVLIAEW